ncbi:MAG: SRPBCC family protein [Acidimicrobiia bacterium]
MKDSVTVHIAAPPETVWGLVSDITNTGKFSPETFEAEWLDGASAPAVGVRFRGHVRRDGRGPVHWTKCEIVACEPGREFTFVAPERVKAVAEESARDKGFRGATGLGARRPRTVGGLGRSPHSLHASLLRARLGGARVAGDSIHRGSRDASERDARVRSPGSGR